MAKVGFWFQDKGIAKVDFSKIREGNPGVGGTEYLFMLLAYYLEKASEEVFVYHYAANELSVSNVYTVTDLDDCIGRAISDKLDVLIVKNLQSMETYKRLNASGLNVIVWAHNFLTYEEIKYFRNAQGIKRIVMVGRQMYDYYIDDIISEKIEFAFNIFEAPLAKNYLRLEEWEHNVTYIGSLVYAKSFHVLANIWKKVLAEVPDAKLHVIGSGKLYDMNACMGKLGLAESSYEEMFLENLKDDKNELLSSVHFHGLVSGEEKLQIVRESAVGVVNPLASTETFCLCATEFEAQGVPVVSRKKNGILDTVIDGRTGLLYKEADLLSTYIVRLLKDRRLNNEMSKNAVEFATNSFTPDIVIPKWQQIIAEVKAGKKPQYYAPVNHYSNNGKWLRCILHALHRIPFLRWIPSIHDIQKK